MTTKTAVVYLFAIVYPGDTEIHYTITTTDMSDVENYTFVESQEVEFEIPEAKAITPLVVESLTGQREKMRAVANAAITQVDNTIASFLALEHDNEV